MHCVRPAPSDLDQYFRKTDLRRVKKDRSFSLCSCLYEAPIGLIDRKIEVKYDEEDMERVEVFFENISLGLAHRIDRHVNARIGRQWESGTISSQEKVINHDIQENSPTIGSGKLPLGDCFSQEGELS